MASIDLTPEPRIDLLSQVKEAVKRTPISETEAQQKAAFTVGAAAPNVLPGTYQEVKDDILGSGGSTLTEVLKQEAARRKAIELQDDLNTIIADPTLSLKVKRDIVAKKAARENDITIKNEFERVVMLTALVDDPNQKQISDSFFDYIINRERLPDLVWKLLGEEGLTYNPDNVIRDVVESIALPGYALQMFEVLNEAIPGFARPGDAVFPGSMVQRFKELFLTLPPDEQEDIIRRIARAAEKNTFFGRDNGAIKHDIIVTLLNDLSPSTSEKVILNVISFLDLLAIGELARIGIAGVRQTLKLTKMIQTKAALTRRIINNYLERKSPHSVSSKLDSLDPKQAKQILSDALDKGDIDLSDPNFVRKFIDEERKAGKQLDPDSVGRYKADIDSTLAFEILARETGESVESLLHAHYLPEPSDFAPTGAPSLHTPKDEVLSFDGAGYYWDRAEKETTKTRLTERMAAIKSIAPAVHMNKLQITPTEGGFKATTFIGLTDSGFPSAKKAKAVLKDIRERFEAELYIKDGRTNELKPIQEVPKEHRIREIFIKVDDEVRYSAEDTLPINPIRGDGTTGMVAKFVTKSSFLIDKWTRGSSAAGGRRASIEKKLSEQLAPRSRLSTNQRRLLDDLIDRGDQTSHQFTPDELFLEWGHRRDYTKLIEGYEGFLVARRSAWVQVNDGIHRLLDGLDLKPVLFKKLPFGSQQYLAKPIAKLPDGEISVFDPKLGKIRDLEQTEIDTILLSEDTLPFLEMSRDFRLGNKEARYALNTSDKSALQIKKLPPVVIKDVPGRLPRTYNATHVVKELVKVFRNGFEIEGRIPIRLARNRGEADRVRDVYRADAEALNNGKKFGTFDAAELREDTEYVQRTSLDFLEDSGQLWYSERGLEMDGIDGFRPVLSIQDRVDVMTRRASRINTTDLWVSKTTRNWESLFGQRFGDPVTHKMPLRGSLFRNEGGLSENLKPFKDAIAARDHILLMAGLDEGMLQRNMRKTMVWAADRLATSSAYSLTDRAKNWSATQLLAARDKSPVNTLKQAAFLEFIVGNPARQLALQIQQASIYVTEEHALRYFASGEGVRDWWGMVGGLAVRDSAGWDAWARTASRGMGMSVDEYTEFVDSIRISGLLANIDSHAFSAGMLTDRTWGGGKGFIQMPGRTLDAANGIVRAAKMVRRLGFNAGEAGHRVVAFLTKRNQWIKNNPDKSTQWAKGENLLEISGRAEQIAFEMTGEGAMAFQKGLLGLIFQFASHNTKAIQALLPQTRFLGIGKLSNKAFNNKQKAAIALTQLGIYGAGAVGPGIAGYGLYEAYEQLKAVIGEEPPEVWDLIIKEGLFGSLVTALVRGTTDEPFDTDISGNLAPFSGIGTVPLFRVMADATAISIFDPRSIPAVGTLGDIKDALEFIAFLVGKEPEAPEGESDILLGLNEIARIMPIWNKYFKSKAEIAVGRFISESGNETVQATAAEIYAKAFFGLDSTANRQGFNFRTQIAGRHSPLIEGPIDEHLRDQARLYYQHMKQYLQRTGDHKVEIRELADLARSIARADRLILDEFEYRRIHEQLMPQQMYSDLRKGTDDAEMIRLVESALRGGRIRTTDSVLQEMGQSEFFRNQEAYAQFLRDVGE